MKGLHMDIISDYYESLSKIKILSKAEEKQEFFKYKNGNSRAGEKLIESCLRLSFSIAKKYWKDNNPETLKDLISSGNEGLLRALNRFDPSKDVKFSTYSAYWVLMYVRKYVVEDSKVVKPPIAIRRKLRLQDATKSPSNIEYKEAQDYNTVCTSPTPEALYEEKDSLAQQQFVLEGVLRFLTSRERLVVSSVYGLKNEPCRSLCSLGRELGLSSERIRQIKESATAKLSSWGNYYS
jgi:RNA polymerase nonessential primary-like sigma factor